MILGGFPLLGVALLQEGTSLSQRLPLITGGKFLQAKCLGDVNETHT